MGKPVNSWQAVVQDLMLSGAVTAKDVASRLHRAPDYLSDICRRERVDPFAVCNEILKQADRKLRNKDIPPEKYMHICCPVLNLLLSDTRWSAVYGAPNEESATSSAKLCEQAGLLCEVLGGTLKALASIEADGRYDEQDNVRIGEYDMQAGRLVNLLQGLQLELHRRRSARVQI